MVVPPQRYFAGIPGLLEPARCPRLAPAQFGRNLGPRFERMPNMLFWLVVLVLLAAAAGGGLWGYRAYMTGDTSFNLGGWFAPKPEPRLGVTEQASVDSRRKLVLVRRDNVEHLIMTGGPVDVVIETGISPPQPQSMTSASAQPSAPVFNRQPRAFG